MNFKKEGLSCGLTKWSRHCPDCFQMLSFLILFLLTPQASSQELVNGIEFYNRGELDSVITFAKNFAAKDPSEEALATYFLAESYYIKTLQESDQSKIVFLLHQAQKAFLKAANSEILKQNYNEYYHFAKYKTGWCSFRLAELRVASGEMLRQAHDEFLGFSENAPDSIKVYSLFMAGESKVRENILRTYLLGTDQFKEIVHSFAETNKLYEKVLSTPLTVFSSANLQALQSIAKIKKEQINYQLGRLYQIQSSAAPARFLNPEERSESERTAQNHFKITDYENTFADLNASTKFQLTLAYLNLMNALHRYISAPDQARKNGLLQGWNRIKTDEFEPEALFRLANVYHSALDVESDEFNELAGNFYGASLLSESTYWLGYLQMIQNKKVSSQKNLQKYIDSFENKKISPRQRHLLEDAQYRKYFLDFETLYLSDNFNSLKTLAQYVEGFSVEGQVTRRRKEELNLLINCSLAKTPDEIWSKVLSGTEGEKLEQAFDAVRFILPRAALNIGLVRERYVFLLNRLFDVTVSRKSDETNFFRGVVGSLEAEIQATPREKIRKFKAAANKLSRVQPNFHSKSEADYIRAKCLFFADEFEQAENILKSLVNDHRYLRALFYLAEIFRLRENGLAAKQCYEIIIKKLQNFKYDYDKFWVENSEAALASIQGKGSLEVLNGIAIELVEFQPSLKAGGLFYEKLADEHLLIQKYKGESLDWLVKFGLPAKTFYPSKYRVDHSLFAANSFDSSPFELNEIRGSLTASLRLQVVSSENINSPVAVRLGRETLAVHDSTYFKSFLTLNSEYEISVTAPEFYPFKMKYQITKLGKNEVVVALTKKLKFQTSKDAGNILKDFNYPLKQRWDENFVLNHIPTQNDDSELLSDFSQNYHLRDLAVDKMGNRILAINAKEKSVWVYSNDALGKRRGSLKLSSNITLNSPEGIVVDSQGTVFIADWGNHRILRVNSEGNFLREIGGFGTNHSAEAEAFVKFVFPTRIAVLEDGDGINVNGNSYQRESYLCVADQNGIHICKLNGEYLGKLLAPDKNFSPGSFYAFIIQGYGQNSKLQLVNRHEHLRGTIFEFAAN